MARLDRCRVYVRVLWKILKWEGENTNRLFTCNMSKNSKKVKKFGSTSGSKIVEKVDIDLLDEGDRVVFLLDSGPSTLAIRYLHTIYSIALGCTRNGKTYSGRSETVAISQGSRFLVIEIIGFGMKSKLLMRKDDLYIVAFVADSAWRTFRNIELLIIDKDYDAASTHSNVCLSYGNESHLVGPKKLFDALLALQSRVQNTWEVALHTFCVHLAEGTRFYAIAEKIFNVLNFERCEVVDEENGEYDWEQEQKINWSKVEGLGDARDLIHIWERLSRALVVYDRTNIWIGEIISSMHFPDPETAKNAISVLASSSIADEITTLFNKGQIDDRQLYQKLIQENV